MGKNAAKCDSTLDNGSRFKVQGSNIFISKRNYVRSNFTHIRNESREPKGSLSPHQNNSIFGHKKCTYIDMN